MLKIDKNFLKNEGIFSNEIAYIASYVVNGLFLILHIFLEIYYVIIDADWMIKLNGISLIIEIFSFYLIKCGKTKIFANILFYEAMIHVTIATLCFGWDCGFQDFHIAIIVLIFFGNYFSQKMGHNDVPALKFCILDIIAYICSFLWFNWFEEIYNISSTLQRYTQLLSAFVIFFIVIAFMWILTQFTVTVEEAMNKKAQFDELTQLPNRYYLMAHFKQLMTKDNGQDNYLAIMDIDDFKKVNDTYGHNCGDYVLKEIACLITKYSKGGFVCRWGGEEFIILGSVEIDMKNQCRILNDIRKFVGNHDFEYEEYKFNITITMGVATYEQGQSVEDWVNVADKKLYAGKYSGKNKLVF